MTSHLSWRALLPAPVIALAAVTLLGAGGVARAATPDAARRTPSPKATPTPTPCQDQPPCLPSPTDTPSPEPTVIVISPVVIDSPSPIPSPTDTSSPSPSALPSLVPTTPSDIPLGGAVDNFPSPPTGTDTSGTVQPGGGGVPWPFLLAGLVLLAGAGGALIYAFAPTPTPLPPLAGTRRRRPTSPVKFTPYGPEAPAELPSTPPPGGGAIPLRRRKP